MKLTALLNKIADNKDLTADEAAQAFNAIMSGDVSAEEMAAFLTSLRTKGETTEELLGAVSTMREKSNKVKAPVNAIDIVGTGGDSLGTVNISTMTALTIAGAGQTVAKHGSRAFSSRSGAGDVLEVLGVNMAAPIPVVERAISEAHIGFLMAPLYHPAMRYVQPIRVKLGIRTIFNLCGPMTNPAGVKHYLIGCYDTKWAKPMAEILKHFGAKHAWIVRGGDGMDELTTTTTSEVTELKNGKIRRFIFDPKDYGVPYAKLDDLIGGSPAENGEVIADVLSGSQKGAVYDIVTMNAGVALYIAGKAKDIAEGIALAKQSIDSGKAKEALNKLIQITNDMELS